MSVEGQSINFDRAADYYDDTRGFPTGEEAKAAAVIAQAGNLTTESRVLEIGIGTGRIALPVSVHAPNYYGIDISTGMMNRLQSKPGSEAIKLAEADMTRLPFETASFDAVVAVHVFHLVPDWQGALDEVERVLKPDGRILICWNDREPENEIAELWKTWNEVIPQEENQRVGVSEAEHHDYLLGKGWQSGELARHEFKSYITPAMHLDGLKNRLWSRLWRMREEDLQDGVAAVEARIAQLFTDVNQRLEINASFKVQPYTRQA